MLVISILFALYHLLLPLYAFLPNIQERAIHLALAFTIIFLGEKYGDSRVKRGFSILLWLLGVAICAYVVVNYSQIIEQYGTATGPLQVAMGIVLVSIVLEAARRMVRSALPLIALLALLYAFWGHLIPGYFGHPPYTLETISSMFILTTGGIWGLLVGVSANVIAIFVFLGAFVVHTGGGTGFMRLSVRLAGRYTGGPAKVSVISSALFGSVSGSASANVATTGAFTIPMMKRLGYNSALAAAVEAVASTGGQIMPPIMGAGAFIMAELIQTPYIKIAAGALLPALLYFFSAGAGIHFYCQGVGYRGLSPDEIPSWGHTLKASVFFLIPFSVLAYWLLRNFTPQYAAFWATLTTIPLALLDENLYIKIRSFVPKILGAIENGARQAALIASICAGAQVIISVIAFTGVGVKISSSIIAISGGQLLLTLVLIALTSIILGMEVPTTAAYIVAVVIGGPILIDLGIPPLAAHLFVFYFAILSAITPPVCGAVFIASGLAESDWVQSAKLALKLSFAAFLVPFLFVHDPALLLLGPHWRSLYGLFRAVLAITFVSASFMGFFRHPLGRIERVTLFVAGIFLFIPNFAINGLGLACGLAVFLRKRNHVSQR